MRVTMRTTYAGERGTAQAGGDIDLPHREAQELIDGGYAFKAVSRGAVENADAPAPERAVAPAQNRTPSRNR